MINKIIFKNYKLFKEKQTLELKPITILIGQNNTGKSAILKLISLLESSLSGRFDYAINFKDTDLHIADFANELIYGSPKHRGELEFELIEENETIREFKTSLYIDEGDFKVKNWQFGKISLYEEGDYYLDNSDGKWLPEFRGLNLDILKNSDGEQSDIPSSQFTSKDLYIDYIGGFREIAKPFYPFDGKTYEKSGINGQNLYHFLIEDTQTTNKKYSDFVSNWIKEKFEGWELKVDYDGHRKDLPARISLEKGSLKVNLSQTGSGIAQVLPLIIRAYKPCSKETLIVLEEPESHLHPYAHAQLAQLFFESLELDKNKKYLIETHSQNFVLRMRRLVAEGKLKHEDLKIYYVDYNEENNYSDLVEVIVKKDGSVDKWPEGVFAETVIEARAIMNANQNDLRNVD